MTRVSPRTRFHSSKLLRCLADLAMLEPVDAGSAFAEKLGEWVHFADAIALSAVHSDATANLPKRAPTANSNTRTAAQAEFDRIQALLVHSIMKSCSSSTARSHIRLPEPRLELPMDLAAAYMPYRRFYEAHQRDMELSIQPLRVNLRDAVAKASPRLRKLAELDAAFEKILREREGRLLARVPVLLKKHFDRLFKEHQQTLAETQQADHPVGWTQAGGWLARFCNDMQSLLLAELELRLQPAMGLVEALSEETK